MKSKVGVGFSRLVLDHSGIMFELLVGSRKKSLEVPVYDGQRGMKIKFFLIGAPHSLRSILCATTEVVANVRYSMHFSAERKN